MDIIEIIELPRAAVFGGAPRIPGMKLLQRAHGGFGALGIRYTS
jgi:hypothetical protein